MAIFYQILFKFEDILQPNQPHNFGDIVPNFTNNFEASLDLN